jgi:hypothetical protein
MSILQLIKKTFGLQAPDLLSSIVQGRLEPSRVLRRALGLGSVGGQVADDGVPGGIVGEMSVQAQPALGQLFLAAKPMEFIGP